MSDENDYKILVKGNTLAKTWARKILGRRKLGRFITTVLNPSRAEGLGITQDQLKEILTIPPDVREAIVATQDVVGRVFTRFDRLALRISRRFASGVGRDNPADVAQLESEARVGLLKAIRGYNRSEIKFVTYAHRAIQNEVSRYLQRCMGIGLTGVNATLLVRYKRKLEDLTKASLPHTFEDVCRELDLKPRQVNRLKDALRAEVTSENEMEDRIANLLIDERRDTKVDLEFIQRLEQTAMTSLEKYAFISQTDEIRALFPGAFPSLKDVADHFDVTPQAASEALKRARKKLAASLGSEWKPGA